MAHQLSLPGDFQTTLDGVAAVIHILQGSGDDVHVVVRVDAARDAEAHEVVAAKSILTRLGFSFGALLGGAAITETLFSRPGLGRLLVDSVASQDIPVVIGVVLVGTAVFILVNTLVDLSYALVDPRVRDADRVIAPSKDDAAAASEPTGADRTEATA